MCGNDGGNGGDDDDCVRSEGVKLNLVITVVVVEEERVGSIFRVKTVVTG